MMTTPTAITYRERMFQCPCGGIVTLAKDLNKSQTAKNGRTDLLPFPHTRKLRGPYFPLLTAFFSSLPGVNLATLRAAILIVAPVWGFRPLRALRCETE